MKANAVAIAVVTISSLITNCSAASDLFISLQTLDIECSDDPATLRFCERFLIQPSVEVSKKDMSTLLRTNVILNTRPFEASFGDKYREPENGSRLESYLEVSVGYPTAGCIPIDIEMFVSDSLSNAYAVKASMCAKPDGYPALIPGSVRTLNARPEDEKSFWIRANALIIESITNSSPKTR